VSTEPSLNVFAKDSPGSARIARVDDGDGNRVSETVGSTTTKYLVDDNNPTGLPQVLDEIVNGSVTRTYAYGLQRISENQLVGSTWTPSFYGFGIHSLEKCERGQAKAFHELDFPYGSKWVLHGVKRSG